MGEDDLFNPYSTYNPTPAKFRTLTPDEYERMFPGDLRTEYSASLYRVSSRHFDRYSYGATSEQAIRLLISEMTGSGLIPRTPPPSTGVDESCFTVAREGSVFRADSAVHNAVAYGYTEAGAKQALVNRILERQKRQEAENVQPKRAGSTQEDKGKSMEFSINTVALVDGTVATISCRPGGGNRITVWQSKPCEDLLDEKGRPVKSAAEVAQALAQDKLNEVVKAWFAEPVTA